MLRTAPVRMRQRREFGSDGEWTDARVLAVQFQKIRGNGIEQFRDASTMQIVLPDQYKTGDLIYPFEKARQCGLVVATACAVATSS